MAHPDHSIVDARSFFRLDLDVADTSKPDIRTPADAYHRLLTQGQGAQHLARHGIAARGIERPERRRDGGDPPPVHARLRWGVWEAKCPDCGAVTVLLKGAPYLCADCGNAAHGHYYRPVEWPADLADIEAVLLERPVFTTRNWTAGDTVSEMVQENRAHGVGVPKHLARLEGPSPAPERGR